MTFSKLKTMKKDRGFTIVELLIVIVVIAILAAIVIVAYNGVQNRARLSSAQGAAQTIVKKASAYAAEGTSGLYPTTFATLTGAAASTSYAVPTSTVTLLTAVPSSAPASPNSIMFYTCGSGAGVKIGYWDFVANAAVSTGTTFTAGDVSGTCTLAAS
jgi:prepilin-type N-terminal cleavage/methylation domain-containing protein